uniref:MTHFR SAM-binding regulatory domain-containing protein n=2 Tax=Polytomella TaxID=3049 RepID=A0A7S0YJX9_9CHLO|nr:methylenetetrahydrofolate reductase [Polytomella sp. Pringsheim 198.80]|mmetsp:Transcript_30187/g.55156  ORF Transcript_30187/g.55156 Transcript_30187/m.55156 type:complete len:630 (+) Transcript_30187:66-1955(+)|eukprot:CAMPEP_0175055328 /NCGR_PEP_ID=MMETSP0052_2-20121109/10016_1 /TAXON_ID=51329 ORGANISM="Polytomella parva, Strain SAG 63-3" /NCGR_SAMPLE_ID=MMETSP0052_2 /ASSEMBLY_ACC=CAM_ASM_000194 /LENGTH=629 /DNA_ID=CAMNT_0016320155 /DNA_START=41 /DNA_END=1930 /DNA_ORIENTATION=+
MKIIDKINLKIEERRPFFSFEFFPPRTEEGVENLFERQERLVSYGPVFCDITWGAGGSTADVTQDIAVKMQNLVGVETMMHLTCTNMPKERLEIALKEVQKAGVKNILALRGDAPKGQDKFEAIEGGFSCALDLVKYIKKEFGSYFGIGVAGYPEAHPDSIVDDPEQMKKNYFENIEYLKKKVDAGADFIITQLFYDANIFIKFMNDCRAAGITCPILPGIMPIASYAGFKRMTSFCKTHVPQHILDAVEAIKDDEEAIKNFGISYGVEMCRKVLAAGAPGVHLYTLNLERSAVGIVEKLGIMPEQLGSRFPLPWRPASIGTDRTNEGVRPIFWANRPKSYVLRTSHWTEFPSKSWTSKLLASAAFDSSVDQKPLSDAVNVATVTEASLASHVIGDVNKYQMTRHICSTLRQERSRASWGIEVSNVEAVKDVFAKFYLGELRGLPWFEHDVPGAAAASIELREQLAVLCRKGILVMNCQPSARETPATDPVVGWGPTKGYVYQKAYLEFFVAPEAFRSLLPVLQGKENVTYMASDVRGEIFHSNAAPGDVNAVTWGVFPGHELVQPFVATLPAFLSWRDEAFALWDEDWAALYPEGSVSRTVLKAIHDTYVLVSITENDFVNGDLLSKF